MGDMMNNMGSFGWGFGFFGSLLMILFWVLVIVGIVALVKWLAASSGSTATPRQGTTPLDILAERFARGEIDCEEFEQRRRDLQSGA